MIAVKYKNKIIMETTKRRFCTSRFYFRFPLMVIGLFAVSGIVMYLWNAIVPSICSSLTALSYWQAMGLFVLSRILFGGFHCRGHHHDHHGHRHAQFVGKFKEKLMEMNEEERQQFKNQWKQRCCKTPNP